MLIFAYLLGALFFGWMIYTKGFTVSRGLGVGCFLFGILSRWNEYADLLRGRATWDDSDDKEERRFPERKADASKPAGT